MNTFQCTQCGILLQRPTQPFNCPNCGRQAINLFRPAGGPMPGQSGYPQQPSYPMQPGMGMPGMPQQAGMPQQMPGQQMPQMPGQQMPMQGMPGQGGYPMRPGYPQQPAPQQGMGMPGYPMPGYGAMPSMPQQPMSGQGYPQQPGMPMQPGYPAQPGMQQPGMPMQPGFGYGAGQSPAAHGSQGAMPAPPGAVRVPRPPMPQAPFRAPGQFAPGGGFPAQPATPQQPPLGQPPFGQPPVGQPPWQQPQAAPAQPVWPQQPAPQPHPFPQQPVPQAPAPQPPAQQQQPPAQPAPFPGAGHMTPPLPTQPFGQAATQPPVQPAPAQPVVVPPTAPPVVPVNVVTQPQPPAPPRQASQPPQQAAPVRPQTPAAQPKTAAPVKPSTPRPTPRPATVPTPPVESRPQRPAAKPVEAAKPPQASKPAAPPKPVEAPRVRPKALRPEQFLWAFPEEPPFEDEAQPMRYAPAVDAEGRIYLHAGDRLVAIEEEAGRAKLCWEYVSGCRAPGPVVLAPDGTLRVHTADGLLHAMNAQGRQLWSPVSVGQPLGYAAPVVDEEGNTYICAFEGGLVKVDPRGKVHKPGPFFRGRQKFDAGAVLQGNVLYVGSDDGYVFAIELGGEKGRNAFNHAIDQGHAGWYIHSSPALGREGELIVAAADDCLYAFRPTGETAWSAEMPGQMLGSPVLDGHGHIYIGLSQSQRGQAPSGSLVCLDGNSHKIRWEYRAAGPVESTPVIGNDDIIYFGDNEGVIHAVDNRGAAQWTAKVESAVRSAGTILAPQRLAFGLDNQTLVVLKCSSDSLAADGWPKFGRTLAQNGGQ